MTEELTTDYRELGKDPCNSTLDTAVTSWVQCSSYCLSSRFKGTLGQDSHRTVVRAKHVKQMSMSEKWKITVSVPDIVVMLPECRVDAYSSYMQL